MISRHRIAELRAREEASFNDRHPRSRELFEQASEHLLGGVPMNWMRRWPGSFPVFVAHAEGSAVTDVDGNVYVDLCMGDTGAMCGHALSFVTEAIAERSRLGSTPMLPTEDAIWVAGELTRRFGMAKWQIVMTATDANRFALRLARHITRRPKILAFNGCYHGTVDETLACLDADGAVVARPGNVGPQVPPATTTKIVEFNDIDALEAALAARDVACVITEPALTNIGIVLPDPGFHSALRDLTRRTGTLLVIDETHTICAGPGGATQAWGLEPDLFVIGKPIAGGIPAAAYGMTDAVAAQLGGFLESHETDVSGVGGTLSANALAVAAIRATLANTLRDDDYERMIPLAQRWTDGVATVIERHKLRWHVQRLGCRAEYWFCPPPRHGGDALAAVDHELDGLMHLYAMNRGILLTPFHNMALMAPTTTAADVDRHTEVFTCAVEELLKG